MYNGVPYLKVASQYKYHNSDNITIQHSTKHFTIRERYQQMSMFTYINDHILSL